MGQATAEGEDRAISAVKTALASPLLNDNDISGARYVLLNITYGDQEVLMDEISEITDYIQDEAGSTADVIWGHGKDADLGSSLSVTVIATGFNASPDVGEGRVPQEKKYNLEAENPREVTGKMESPIVEPQPEPTSTWTETPVETNTWTESKEEEVEEPYMKTEEEEAPQTSFEFEVKSPFAAPAPEEPAAQTPPPNDGMKRYSLDDDYEDEASSEEPRLTTTSEPENNWAEAKKPTEEEAENQARISQERLSRIREISTKLKTPSGLTELENQPAYERRNIQLDDTPHSSESSVSRYTLGEEGEEGEGRAGLNDNNSYLHDNVD